MAVTDETYVSAYRGILAAKGDSINNINEIGGDLTAGSLYNILGYNVGILKNILNEFAYEVNGTTISIKSGQAICYGYIGKIDNTIDFTLVAPSATDKYYFIVADFDLKSATVADFSIGLFNNNNSSSYTPTNLDNLNENSTGRYQYKMYMIKIDTSSVVTVTDLRDIKESVKNAENATLVTNGVYTTDFNKTQETKFGNYIVPKLEILYNNYSVGTSSFSLSVNNGDELEVYVRMPNVNFTGIPDVNTFNLNPIKIEIKAVSPNATSVKVPVLYAVTNNYQYWAMVTITANTTSISINSSSLFVWGSTNTATPVIGDNIQVVGNPGSVQPVMTKIVKIIQ